jgi:peroxiredoxin
MVALIEGTSAPTFTLKSLDNKPYSLSTALEESPLLLLAFFKVDCPVCQMTAPYIQRLKDRHPGAAIVGISQDDERESRQFAATYGLSIPVLLDLDLETTEKYDLTNVPTLFLLEAIKSKPQQAKIVFTMVSFASDELETIDSKLFAGEKHESPLFTPLDDVPQFRPG